MRGLDFYGHPEDKTNFIKYAVELRYLKPIVDSNLMPPLEDLAKPSTFFFQWDYNQTRSHCESRRKYYKWMGPTKMLLPIQHDPCNRNLRINPPLGAGDIITPGRIIDSKGAKIVVISFKTTTGAIQAVQRHTYSFVCVRE